jgi:Tol biopolymer transport system component
MKRLTLAIATALLFASGVHAQDPARMLRTAMNTETIDGDLAGAIKQYQAIVDKYGKTDRATAAQALLRMADVYQKLGYKQARTIYERIVSQYAEQKDAVVVARTHLGGTQVPHSSVPTQRVVWTGRYVDMFGQVSPDGGSITFTDWVRSNNLMVHDTVNNTDRSLTGLTPFVGNPSWTFQGESDWSVISKDGKQVAYVWVTSTGPPELRVMPLQGKPNTDSRRLFLSGDDIQFLSPRDWSADGQWIATAVNRRDGSGQIGLIRTADGSFLLLKSVSWRGPERIFFSPDSRFIAYDLPASDETDQRDVFVMSVDGSREIHAVDNQADDRLMGWSPDGRLLLFSSNRTGSTDLWAQPFSAGRADGDPQLLRSDVNGFSLGLTASGALYIYKSVSDRDVRTVRMDLAGGKVVGPPTKFDRGFLSGILTTPSWSPDGKFLAYQADDSPNAAIAIRTVATGEVRRLPGLYARDPRWSPDGRSLISAARDRRGRNGIFRVDAQTGETTVVVLGPRFGAMPRWSPDGSKIYYKPTPTRIVERDVKSGEEREVFSQPGLDIYEPAPDGRHLAVRTLVEGVAERLANVLLVSFDGSQPRELFPAALDGQNTQRTIAWTPDGKAVLVLKRPTDAPSELWLAPVDGGLPRKVDTIGDGWPSGALDSGFALSADGQQIAFLTGSSSAEVWALENFLPPAPAARK